MNIIFALLSSGFLAFIGRRILKGFRSGWMQMPVRFWSNDPYFCRADEPCLFWTAAMLNGFYAALGALCSILGLFRFVTGK